MNTTVTEQTILTIDGKQYRLTLIEQQPEPEQGMTWERAFDIVKPKWWVGADGLYKNDFECPHVNLGHVQLPTEADAKSHAAFIKLTVIAAACNQGKEAGKERYGVELINDVLSICAYEAYKGLIEFYDMADRDQSMITNRQLWLDLYKKS